MPNETLYESDFIAWTEQQAEALRRAARERANTPLDWDNLAEEIESLGRRDRREAKSHISNIMEHLLKLGCSPASRPRAKWMRETSEFRQQLRLVLADSPSLRARVGDMIAEAWPAALENIESELSHHNEIDAARPALEAFIRKGAFTETEVLNAGVFLEPASSALNGNSH